MSAELVLAVLGLVDGCIKARLLTYRLANKAISTCRTYCNAEDDLSSKLLILETRWIRLETQLEFLRRIKDHLTEELAQCHFDLVQKLHSILLKTSSELVIAASSIGTKPSPSRLSSMFQTSRWKYTFRKSFENLMAELEAWQKLFDPSWYLILLIGGNILDPVFSPPQRALPEGVQSLESQPPTGPLGSMRSLHRAIEAAHAKGPNPDHVSCVDYEASQLLDAREERITYSTARAIFLAGSDQVLIIESVDLSAGTASKSTITAVEHLARKLQHVDPDTFGLLRCDGILKKTDLIRGEYHLRGLEIIYRAPSTTSTPPVTLRQLLLDQPSVSLSAIVQLAKQLVRSVSYIHACDFVHKNIRPENILVFATTSTPSTDTGGQPELTLADAFLVGFNQFRPTHHQTNLLGDIAWHRNLYRHPTRQGLCILEKYVMQHDIYALGVCLLEIGLWRTLVAYPPVNSNNSTSNDGGGGWEELLIPATGFALELRRTLTDQDFKRAHIPGATAWVKDDLVKMTRRLLPRQMGELYTGVVLDCLTCLDEGNQIFGVLGGNDTAVGEGKCGDSENKEERIVVGVRFVETILTKIAQISV